MTLNSNERVNIGMRSFYCMRKGSIGLSCFQLEITLCYQLAKWQQGNGMAKEHRARNEWKVEYLFLTDAKSGGKF